MPGTKAGLAVCIPTYRRPELLRRLLADLGRQTVWPDLLIVVDGDPSSGEARAVVESTVWEAPSIVYVPSNHANLPFQRYLAWRAAARQRWIVYFDDDLRLPREDTVEKLIVPLEVLAGDVVGVTAHIDFPNRKTNGKGGGSPEGHWEGALAKRFGSSRSTQAGDLTPVGYRKAPPYTGEPYSAIKWLRGGVMAFEREALDFECFGENLLALAERRAGLGEDTILSRKAASRGQLLLAQRVRVEHPGDDPPRAYSSRGFLAGFAQAYSRRLINDSYRGFDQPTWSDRVALAKHYAGMNLINFQRSCLRPGWDQWNFTCGYAWGTWRGVFQPPTARRLAPGVDWRHDASECLRRIVLLSREVVCR